MFLPSRAESTAVYMQGFEDGCAFVLLGHKPVSPERLYSRWNEGFQAGKRHAERTRNVKVPEHVESD